MRHLFVVDPLASLDVKADTSIAFMQEAARRGHEVCACEVGDLSVRPGGRPGARVVPLSVRESDDWYEAGPASPVPLDEFDAVWMRKDPPYDLDYFWNSHVLGLVRSPTLIVNDARALREVTEKMWVLRFPELCPTTLISRNIAELEAFRAELGGEMIVKPLDGCGGAGVFHLVPGDRNAGALLELATRQETAYQIAQAYLPAVREGDKRIILVDGEPVGAVLRVPKDYETRSNFHAGGSARRTELSARDLEICAAIGPALREEGVLFAGIDVIGDYLTEVNVTSPTGVREIDALSGLVLEATVLDAVERAWRRRNEG